MIEDEGDKAIDEAWNLIKDLVDKESLEALGLLEDKEGPHHEVYNRMLKDIEDGNINNIRIDMRDRGKEDKK